jgi:two-component system sensor histidine kinase KdpD
MGGTLEPEETPGGGLTMALSLPAMPGAARTLPGEHTGPAPGPAAT